MTNYFTKLQLLRLAVGSDGVNWPLLEEAPPSGAVQRMRKRIYEQEDTLDG
jgi:hypothetical protein